MRKLVVLGLVFLSLVSCSIEQTTTFNKNGSGIYDFNLKMFGGRLVLPKTANKIPDKSLDTIIVFNKFLAEKKDSIAKLPPQEKARLMALKGYSIEMKNDTAKDEINFKIGYDFENVKDLSKVFSRIKEEAVMKKAKNVYFKNEKDSDDLFRNISIDNFVISFDKQHFSVALSEKAKAEIKKHTDNGKKAPSEDWFSDIINIKTRYVFPYKVKSVDNENVTILYNFKGIEFYINPLVFIKNPSAYDVNVQFEN